MLRLPQWVLLEEPSQDSQKQPEMIILEHTWQKMKKELAESMLAMGFLPTSANIKHNRSFLVDRGFRQSIYRHWNKHHQSYALPQGYYYLIYRLITKISVCHHPLETNIFSLKVRTIPMFNHISPLLGKIFLWTILINTLHLWQGSQWDSCTWLTLLIGLKKLLTHFMCEENWWTKPFSSQQSTLSNSGI